jgi:hypothetical protein
MNSMRAVSYLPAELRVYAFAMVLYYLVRW